MSAVPPSTGRGVLAKPGKDGKPEFAWTLTSSNIMDTVKLTVGPFDVLPVVFVPGIMGSNLKSTKSGKPVWRLDQGMFGVPWGLLKGVAQEGPGGRQNLLHPDRCTVDDNGAVPPNSGVHTSDVYRARGWGTVGEGSYHKFLLWLEEKLNPLDRNPARWNDYYQTQATISAPPVPGAEPKLFPGVRMGLKGEPFNAEVTPFDSILTDDLLKRSKFLMPVYAVGYNWLDSNANAATKLRERINAIIVENNKGQFSCKQVILVTHSMGGLVARACAQLEGMDSAIVGIVHGVMPAVGAAVAYRRCKIGMRDEDFGAGLVIGSTGQEVTAVFSQAPGALQLLPSKKYAPNWLKVSDANGKPLQTLPKTNDPYADIYLERKQWWGLVNEAWLSPKDGAAIDWGKFVKNVDVAGKFHSKLGNAYHRNTYVFYGAEDQKKTSFESVTWRMKAGIRPDDHVPSAASVVSMAHQQVRNEGRNPGYVGGQTEVMPSYGMGMGSTYESSYWELHCDMHDGAGDGTVPKSSGCAPIAQNESAVQQQFKLKGIEHEPAYKDGTARMATLYAITKIVGTAKVPV